MKRICEYLVRAGLGASLTSIAGCSDLSSAVGDAAADAPQVASAIETICDDLLPVAEATANALAKGGAAATIQFAETDDVAPACAAAKSAATAVDGGWLADVVKSSVTTAANSEVSAAPMPLSGGN